MQIWAESGKSALPICNYSQILYQFLTFTQNLKRSHSLWYFICQRFVFVIHNTVSFPFGTSFLIQSIDLYFVFDKDELFSSFFQKEKRLAEHLPDAFV